MKPRILFLTTLLPFPLDNGGKIKTYNTIEALSRNYDIDLVCYVNKKEDLVYLENIKNIVKDVQVVQKNMIRSTSTKNFLIDYFKSLIRVYPYSINKFYTSELEIKIINKLKEENYKYIYIDHLPMMVYQHLFPKNKLVLDQHNVESLIFKRFIETESNFIKKALGLLEFIKLKRFEIKSLKFAQQIICLSENDKEVFKGFGVKEEKLNVIPIHLKLNKKYEYQKKEKDKLKILFLGSMSWYPNQNGIRWFMENVWFNLNQNDYEMYIVGSNPPNYIQKYHNGQNVFVTGYVDDVDEYIRQCDVSVVPLFVGSGQRVKIIESFAKGIPVISTSIGAEGLIYEKNKSIIIADNAKQFIESLNMLKKDTNKLIELSENGKKLFYKHYSFENLPHKLTDVLNKLDLEDDLVEKK
ncbi:hypothetical protein C0971_16795 [Bacillus methanolicus]|uniref:glycosyltransferase family 4 protein n=1 Tax=Bacillus methanolicus TaxID=1471 RepID=UPI00200EF2A5|nr:glycosyltransferase family 4 protein [Bacillus methanolicus]UQD53492.1 hypothetical protein C0971_16795 [Bacillus methanolicus]